MKIQKKNLAGGAGGGGRVGGEDGCDRGSEVFCENSKKKYFFLGGGGGSGRGGGFSVDVNEELKFL